MYHRATKLIFLEDMTIEVTFLDGKVIQYDISQMFSKYPQLKELKRNRKLFLSGRLDPLGDGIIWNDELDFSTDSVYENGVVVRELEVTINQRLGALLMMTRIKKNITQKELAKLSHIDQGDISKIEKGIGNPTLLKISKLFDALNEKLIFDIKK